jgi:hypothetical protein
MHLHVFVEDFVADEDVVGVFPILLVVPLFTACFSSPAPSITKQTPTSLPKSSSTQQIAYSCQLQRTSVNTSATLGPEVQGVANHSELWALIQSTTGVPPKAKSSVKIVWRMKGNGTFSLVALNAQGKHLLPNHEPEAHGVSNWNRPGDEWGSIFTFATAGCWDLHASRDGASGDVWLNIVQ